MSVVGITQSYIEHISIDCAIRKKQKPKITSQKHTLLPYPHPPLQKTSNTRVKDITQIHKIQYPGCKITLEITNFIVQFH